MKILNYCIFNLFIIVGCAGSTSSKDESKTNSNIIDIVTSFENSRTVRLSEIADSVTFIRFETNQQSLMAQNQSLTFSASYIFYMGMYFDWNGKYGGTIVKRGQGPYEEPEGGQLTYHDNHFYSKSSKFIEYDSTGKPIGKVRNLFASREFVSNDMLRWSTGFSFVGENFIVYDTRSVTLYFFDKNFEMVSLKEVKQTNPLIKPPALSCVKESYGTFHETYRSAT